MNAVGESVLKRERLNPPPVCSWPVFNVEPQDGLPKLTQQTSREECRTHQRAAGAVATAGASIDHGLGRGYAA